MQKIDWARKLTSRKLWTAIASFVSMMAVALGFAETQATQIAALVMAGATVIAYIVGEGLVDAANTTLVLDVPEEIEVVEDLDPDQLHM